MDKETLLKIIQSEIEEWEKEENNQFPDGYDVYDDCSIADYYTVSGAICGLVNLKKRIENLTTF